MRIPLIIGGVVLAILAILAGLTFAIIGFGSPSVMMARAKLAGHHWHMGQQVGFLDGLSEVWLWGRCVRASGLDNAPIKRSYLTDSERSCGKSALKHAESLVVKKGNRAAKELAIEWYDTAEALSVPDDFSAGVALSNRILSNDLPANLMPGMEPGQVRSNAVLTILIAAWHGDQTAMVRAADLLLEGNTPQENIGVPREIEAYALLLQAKAKGEDVEERIGLVGMLLDTQVRWEIQDWLKATGRIPA